MNKYSKSSSRRLDEADERLQRLMKQVLLTYDHSILCGHRNEEDQNYAYLTKASKLRYPESKHNSLPSKAIDIQPYPYNNLWDLHHFIGYVQATAEWMGIKIRCGRDWNDNMRSDDETFLDVFHIELVD